MEAYLLRDPPAGELRRLSAGTVLMREGEDAKELYYLVSGEVVVERRGGEIGRARAGWLGTIGMLAGQRTATVRAVSDCNLYVFADMTHPRLMEAIRQDPSLAIGLLEDLMRSLVDPDALAISSPNSPAATCACSTSSP